MINGMRAYTLGRSSDWPRQKEEPQPQPRCPVPRAFGRTRAQP